MELTCTTSGESHGPSLAATVSGLPEGMPLDAAWIDRMLARRQMGYGRSSRMTKERDAAEIVAGLCRGKTTGGPLTMLVRNAVRNIDVFKPIHRPRPGHADLAGMFKFVTDDARIVSERASARGTAARVAAGAVATQLLSAFDIDVLGFVSAIGRVAAAAPSGLTPTALHRRRDSSEFFFADKGRDAAAKRVIAWAIRDGNTLGGIVEVRVFGLPPGIGSSERWDLKLDAAIAGALMSVQTIKGVEVGLGFRSAVLPGARVHDPILIRRGGIVRPTNNSGGIEGGFSNGQTIVVRAASKPIPSLRRPMKSVDMRSKRAAEAQFERSDVCAVPAASVIAEAVVGFEIARLFLLKFGADTFRETQCRYKKYLDDTQKLMRRR